MTGGGGYNPYTVGRCWAGVWATLNDIPIPDRTTPEAEAVLRALIYNRAAGRNPPEHWFTTLRDAPREGPVRRRNPAPRRPSAIWSIACMNRRTAARRSAPAACR